MTPIDGGRDRPARRRSVSRESRAGLRDGPAAAGRTAGRDDADRLLRRALDGRDLHDRRPRHARPGAGAAVRLSASGGVAAAAEDAGRSFGRLSHPPDRGRRRCRADLRFLGGRARRSELSSASASSRSPRSCDRCVRPIPMCRSSAFRRAPAAATTTYRAEDRCDGARPRLDGAAGAGAADLQTEGAVQGNLDPHAARRRRQGARRGRRRDPGRAGRRSADLQSRPRHHAGDADRACRGDGRAGQERDGDER